MRIKEMQELNIYFGGRHQQHTGTSRELWAEVSIVTIAKEMVLGKLKALNVDKSPEPVGQHPRLLKAIAEKIVEALVVIFQESLEGGKVPEDWKKANVTPLVKKGMRQKTRNCRLVNLSSVIRKILDSIIKDEFVEYLEVH
eukprot:g47763.t1